MDIEEPFLETQRIQSETAVKEEAAETTNENSKAVFGSVAYLQCLFRMTVKKLEMEEPYLNMPLRERPENLKEEATQTMS
ncbi:unnamed protein product [Cyprideis torosa]|uniref:Uncharacterized protein n=1 Tax=Cyprideis torosa TaxID=163714 RepID=A0A7R8WNN7_9CRUS|nr:unnamed protein product [Cyprideis torosa]CAG0906479.1 unnamed protein product [Cyprideis torosa]